MNHGRNINVHLTIHVPPFLYVRRRVVIGVRASTARNEKISLWLPMKITDRGIYRFINCPVKISSHFIGVPVSAVW